MFYSLPKTNFNFWVTFILSSANAFYLEQSEISLFGIELKKYPVGTLEGKINDQLIIFLVYWAINMASQILLIWPKN